MRYSWTVILAGVVSCLPSNGPLRPDVPKESSAVVLRRWTTSSTYSPIPTPTHQNTETVESPQAVITTKGHTITALQSGSSIILEDGTSKTTVADGASVTFQGQTFKAPLHGGSIVVNGKSTPLTFAKQVVVTDTITAVASGNSVILYGGSSTITIKDGARTTFEGQRVSVASNGRSIEINGETALIPSETATGKTTTTTEKRSASTEKTTNTKQTKSKQTSTNQPTKKHTTKKHTTKKHTTKKHTTKKHTTKEHTTKKQTNTKQTNTKQTTSTNGGLIVPITTPVSSPKPTSGGTIIPCSLWFFNTCLRWDDFHISGWAIHLPKGVRPPGPPPHISIAPSFSVSVHITGKLDWPKITVGSNSLPTYPAKPTNGPSNGCKTQTATLCATSTAISVATSGQRAITSKHSTSTCVPIYGCEVEPSSTTITARTTTTGSASETSYVVYPKDSKDKEQVNAIETELEKYVTKGASIDSLKDATLGTLYWILPLNESSAAQIRADPDVISFYPQCNVSCTQGPSCPDGCYDPTTEAVFQAQAPKDPSQSNLVFPQQLSFVSLPPGRSLTEYPFAGRYYFDDSAAKDVKVYVIDTGAMKDHPEFSLIRDKMKWIFVAPDADGQEPEDDSPNSKGGFHGTAMLSLVAGKTLGVAKLIEPIVVRMPRRAKQPDESSPMPPAVFTPENYLKALKLISDQLETATGHAGAVVLMAEYFPPSAFLHGNYQGWVQSFHDLLQQLINQGALLVTGGSNELRLKDTVLDGWPASFGKPANTAYYIPSLLVAGGLSLDGTSFPYVFQGGVPNVYAPGEGITIADAHPGLPPYRIGHKGNSDAAALTAGLAAYFLKLAQLGQLKDQDGNSVPQTVRAIANHLRDTAWPRRNLILGEARSGIWNGLKPNQLGKVCEWMPPGRPSRRNNSKGSCINPSLSTTTSKASTTTTLTTNTKPKTTKKTATNEIKTTTTKVTKTITLGSGCDPIMCSA